MAKIKVYSKEGKAGSEIELDDRIFGARVNKVLLDDVTRLFANNKRTGLAHTKTFSEIRGGGKKPWKQKGTGRARTSSIRNPIWRGGGTIFGPRRRKIEFHIPQQLRNKAIISALSQKFKDGNIVVVEDVKLTAPKTKEIASMLKALELHTVSSVLFVPTTREEDLKRATNNIQKLSFHASKDVNAYHIMRRNKVVLEKSAIEALSKRLESVL